MRADIVPGARFPDYELTDHTRTRRRLSELQENDPMILILSRGHYCPKDHQQHLARMDVRGSGAGFDSDLGLELGERFLKLSGAQQIDSDRVMNARKSSLGL